MLTLMSATKYTVVSDGNGQVGNRATVPHPPLVDESLNENRRVMICSQNAAFRYSTKEQR